MSIKPYFTYGAKASDRDLVTSVTKYSNQIKRYFSSLDAEIFIGAERIIDINRIDFEYREQKMPVYGFNSFLPSRIFVGQKIVQGTFVINFTEAGYIANLLNKVDESKLSSPFDKVGISCDSDNSAMFKKTFDILIGYGGYNVAEEASFRNTCQVIRGVHINGYQQILDTSGEPVQEMYSFIAKDISIIDTTTVDKIVSVEETVVGGKGKARNFEYENTIESINSNEIEVSVMHSLLDESSSMIEVVSDFTFDKNNDCINSAKITVCDNEINLSKTYSLNYYQNKWIVRLDSEDTSKIKNKLKNNKIVVCSLELEIKRANNFEIENITKNVGMYKNNGY